MEKVRGGKKMQRLLVYALGGALGFAMALPLTAQEATQSYTEAFNQGQGAQTPQATAVRGGIVHVEVNDRASLTFFTDREAFNATCPELPLEDFEKTNAPPNSVVSCSLPISSASDDACYSPGAIIDGFVLDGIPVVGGGELVVLTPSAFGVNGQEERNMRMKIKTCS
jgi:hypothetical protein